MRLKTSASSTMTLEPRIFVLQQRPDFSERAPGWVLCVLGAGAVAGGVAISFGHSGALTAPPTNSYLRPLATPANQGIDEVTEDLLGTTFPPDPRPPETRPSDTTKIRQLTKRALVTAEREHKKAFLDAQVHWAETVSTHMESEYLHQIVADGWISAETASRAEAVLYDLRQRVVGLHVPTIAPGADGLVGFTWKGPRHYFNLEIRSDGIIECFHEDLETGSLWSDEGDEVSASFVSRLALYASSAQLVA